MALSSSHSRRVVHFALLAVGLGLVIWQTGPRPSACLLDPTSPFWGSDAAGLGSMTPPPSEPERDVGPLIPKGPGKRAVVAPVESAEPRFAPHQLWAITPPPASAPVWEAQVPASAASIRYVKVNRSLLHGKSARVWRVGEKLVLPMADGPEVEVEITRTEARGPDRFVVQGILPGVAESRFLMAVNQQHVAVSVDGLPAGEIKLRSLGPTPDPVVQLYTVDPALEGRCGAREPSQLIKGLAAAQIGTSTPAVPVAAMREPLANGQAVVDVLVAFSPDVRLALGGLAATINQIDLGFAKVQSDFVNSGITAQLRLVDTLETDLAEDQITNRDAGWQGDFLEKLAASQDNYLDEVPAYRDAVGADLVCMVVARSDSESSGIAYLMDKMDSFTAPILAYSVINFAKLSDGTVMAHELGHSFGCAHDRENAGTSGGVFDHSHGFRTQGQLTAGGTGTVRTIMAYAPGNRVRYFSNPNLTVNTYVNNGRSFSFTAPLSLGSPQGQPDASDNARSINETAFQVANHRLSPDRGYAGRLVNVSTRAWVGSGDRTLIGGFVLSGEGTQRVLIRAAGPAIGAAPFNVPDALADPELRIDHIGVGFVAANDDWGLPVVNAAAVAAAANTAGAFTYANGSLDAGLVLDLPAPGNFTASVIGAGGAQGYGIVEVYEVGSTATTRLLNLSTRGYAEMERPMIAGFVVNADPGAEDQRKTMFIRVRGPSLVNYGLPESTVMSDPTIEIYDADADLIYINDDWDPPSADIDGTSRDGIPILLRGQVDQLSELAVFTAAAAVGATDMQPTEPGVVIELPPGIYTIFIRPFESLPDQPADPGVAIVEVFELAPDV